MQSNAALQSYANFPKTISSKFLSAPYGGSTWVGKIIKPIELNNFNEKKKCSPINGNHSKLVKISVFSDVVSNFLAAVYIVLFVSVASTNISAIVVVVFIQCVYELVAC